MTFIFLVIGIRPQGLLRSHVVSTLVTPSPGKTLRMRGDEPYDTRDFMYIYNMYTSRVGSFLLIIPRRTARPS